MSRSPRIIEIYENSHLPIKGWLQSCFRCKNITSFMKNMKTVKRNGRIYKFNVYICKDCKSNFKKNKKDFQTFKIMCHNYIRNEYDYIIR